MRIKIKKITTNLLFQLALTVVLCSLCHNYVEINTIRFFLTVSVILREALMLVLPFLVFSFVAIALSEIKKDVMFLVLSLMAIVFISNFFHVALSGILGFSLLSNVETMEIIRRSEILPFFQIQLINMAYIIIALVIGVGIGFYNSFYENKYISLAIYKIHSLVMQFMQNFFIPLLPLFIGGFLLKLFSENQMNGFISTNIIVFLKLLLFLLIYFSFWLFVSAKFKINRASEILKNIFPAILTAFVTMSSAVALPLSLNASEKNTKDKSFTNVVMPLTLSFHLIGDTIIVPIMCMIVLLVFNHPLPTIYNFLIFSVFFIINQFAGAGVPNATIMVLIPVLKQYYGYDDVMIAFAIAFYAIMEPISTVGNVAANNIFVILLHRIKRKHTVTCNNS